MNLRAAGFATALHKQSIRAATIPSPGGEGKGEGELPTHHLILGYSCRTLTNDAATV
jgi:hypothetical protein